MFDGNPVPTSGSDSTAASKLSNSILTRDRLIHALDVPSEEDAKKIVEKIGSQVTFYKIGLELFMSGSYLSLLDWLIKKEKKVFVDLKFFDVPQTVGSAVANLAGKGATFCTVHGNDEILRAAVNAKGDELKVLAVTVLTSLDKGDLKDLGFRDVEVIDVVLPRAKRAQQIGCDGVICSGKEAAEIRKNISSSFLVVVPGIRPIENNLVDDQKRTVDVEEAFDNGADYIVVGRPIRERKDPAKAAAAIQKRIEKYFND